jgi:hypothetical protein
VNRILVAGLCMGLLASGVARADDVVDRFEVQVRVIEASPGEKLWVDPSLLPLAQDLSTLPFKTFKLADQHVKTLAEGEKLTFQFPGHGKLDERFLIVTAHGQQKGGKLRFQLAIEALDFDTLVAVPDGGTIIVGGPSRTKNENLLFAVTAKKQKPTPPKK